jgi:hypothetical protein
MPDPLREQFAHGQPAAAPVNTAGRRRLVRYAQASASDRLANVRVPTSTLPLLAMP